MKFLRRDALVAALFGGGLLGLRSLATGLPISFVMNPRKALADMQKQTCTGDVAKAQYVIFNTLSSGDPLGCNAPGTYADTNTTGLSTLAHPDGMAYPMMAPTPITVGGRIYTAATAWSWLGAGDGSSTYANVLSRTSFCHIMTGTPVHPKEPQVLELMGATVAQEMFPSVVSKALAPCLGTLQTQPVSIGAAGPTEALVFDGQPQPVIPPSALKATLTNAAGPLSQLQPLRDNTLNKLHDYYAAHTLSVSQKQHIDSMILSQNEVRGISQQTLGMLSSIKGNSPTDQVTAAVALILMKVSPVIAVRFPFGGDNHNDATLKNEAAQTGASMQTIVTLLQQLQAVGLADNVSFVTLNVFGRTMGATTSANGRNHNANHQMSLMIGKGFKGAVIGGVGPVGNDYGCLSIQSATGAGVATGGDIAPAYTLPSWAKTVMAGVGIDQQTIDAQITSGNLVTAALA